MVHSGTYAESILSWETKIPNGKSWEQPITIAAYPGDSVTILPGPGKAFFWIRDPQAKYLVIDGFIVDGQMQALHGFKFQSGPTHIRVQNTEIKNAKHSAILVTVPSDYSGPSPDTYHEFINLHVHHNGSSIKDHGFYIQTSRNLVEDGRFHHNMGNGGKFFQASLSGVANHNIARNNVFHDNSQSRQWSCGLILSSGEGNMAYDNIAYGNFAGFCIQARVTNAQLFNNIAYENEYYGIYVGFETTEGSRVENNTVYKNGVYGIFVGDKAKNTTVTNNIAYLNANNSSARNIGLQKQTGTIVSQNFTSDPLFENAEAKDFRLKSNSPAIKKGISVPGISFDDKGKGKSKGKAPDIGAYEFQNNGTVRGESSKVLINPEKLGRVIQQSSAPKIIRPTLIAPPAGSTLSGSTETFSWSTLPTAQEYFLQIGTGLGQPNDPLTKNIFNATVPATQQSMTVHQLPTNGMPLYVRFWYKQDDQWIINESVSFKAASLNARISPERSPILTPTLIAPPAGSILSGSTETFSWSTLPTAQEYFLQIGTGLGQPNDPLTKNIFNATVPASQDRVVVHQLPTNGIPLYVRFWYKQDNQWVANEQLLFRAVSSPMGNLPPGPN
ncbi:MAG: right-handed parallel beta-helix repeat-containing protein [Nitrospirales bacterium]|nr:right-handed parallel beta-helix repeat-containing protein [Nitrospirales bacterium]